MQRDQSMEMIPVIHREWHIIDVNNVAITKQLCSSNPWDPKYWYCPLSGTHEVNVTAFVTMEQATQALKEQLLQRMEIASDNFHSFLEQYGDE